MKAKTYVVIGGPRERAVLQPGEDTKTFYTLLRSFAAGTIIDITDRSQFKPQTYKLVSVKHGNVIHTALTLNGDPKPLTEYIREAETEALRASRVALLRELAPVEAKV